MVIVSNAGGPAIISTDACSKYGMKLADISASTEIIAKVIPAHGSARNPVDIVGDADFNRFEKVLNEVVSNPKCRINCYYVYSISYSIMMILQKL